MRKFIDLITESYHVGIKVSVRGGMITALRNSLESMKVDYEEAKVGITRSEFIIRGAPEKIDHIGTVLIKHGYEIEEY